MCVSYWPLIFLDILKYKVALYWLTPEVTKTPFKSLVTKIEKPFTSITFNSTLYGSDKRTTVDDVVYNFSPFISMNL